MITCHVTYHIDPGKLADFERYARMWLELVPRFGGVHHGYYLPAGPGGDVAVALFSFASKAVLDAYRQRTTDDEACQAARRFAQQTACFVRYEARLLQRVPTAEQSPVTPMLKLLGKTSSINVRKVLWLCEEMDLAPEHEAWGSGFRPTQTAEFLALNPNGLVPVLIDGDLVLWESNTICRYLAARQRREDLLPAAPAQRAAVEQWMDWQATDLNSAWRYVFMARVRQSPQHRDEAAIAASEAEWTRLMTILDRQLAKTGAYVTGPVFTLADIVLGVSANRWFMTPMVRPELPALNAWYQRLNQRTAFLRHGNNGTP